ncbi:NtaA/DmoA family FMN-dependent monooxygenase [Okibacterium endophyticum]
MRKMVLTAFVMPLGYHRNSWRREGSFAEDVPSLSLVKKIASMAEKAKLDALFFGDIVHANPTLRGDTMMNGFFEPMTTLAALAASTSKIGLIGTLSTSLSEPYNVARQLASLDHLSGGRAGWNIVTSSDGFRNFGIGEAPGPVERYRRATEFVSVVEALWDSWSDDAVIVDRAAGYWLDTSKLRKIDHVGEFFSVEGPLNIPRIPQGRPVLVQAGSSGPGLELGTRVADAIYTAQPELGRAIEFYMNAEAKALESHTKGLRKCASAPLVIPGIVPVVADSKEEADEIAQELAALLDIDEGRAQLGGDLGVDLSDVDLDDVIPAEKFEQVERMTSRQKIYQTMSLQHRLPLRELIVERARSTGHQWISGTASFIADVMQEWFESRACDGFNLNSPYNLEGFERICSDLVPELQNRGLFRHEYEGSTLRDHLGIPRPDVNF